MRRELWRFVVIGGVGFVVDAGLLYLLLQFIPAPFLLRLVTFPVAVTVTWWLNRSWTFADRPSGASTSQEYGLYVAVQVVGAAVNYLAYSAVLLRYGTSPELAMLGMVVGSACGLFVNFAGARLVVFRRGSAHD